MPIDWEIELFKAQVQRETNQVIKELNEIMKEYLDKYKCVDCGGDGKYTLNGSQYCESCFLEHTGRSPYIGYTQEDYEQPY
jgi:hypothetical protein